MTSLKEGLMTTIALILLQYSVQVIGVPLKPGENNGSFLSILKGKDSNADGIAEHLNTKPDSDMLDVSRDLPELKSFQKSSEFPPEALDDRENARKVANADQVPVGGNNEKKKEKYVWIATPNWTRSLKTAQREAAAEGLPFTIGEQQIGGQEKSNDGSSKGEKKEKYVWIATPNWTRSLKTAQREIASESPVAAFTEAELSSNEEGEAFLTPAEGEKEKFIWTATPNWTRSLKAAQKEAVVTAAPFSAFKKAIRGKTKEENPTAAAEQSKKDKYVWYAVPEYASSQQDSQSVTGDDSSSDANDHHRQKRFVTPYKLRLIAVPVSIFNYLGFLPIKIPGLPYHDDLPPPDYTYYNTMHDLKSPERVRYFF